MDNSNKATMRRIWLAAAGIACLVAFLIFLYLILGHWFSQSLYRGDFPTLAKMLMGDAKPASLGDVEKRVGELFWNRLVVGVPLTIGFWLFVFVLVKKLVAETRAVPEEHKYQATEFRFDALIALGIFSVVTVLMFLSVIPDIGHRLIGPPEDNMQFYWNLWWFNDVVVAGHGSLTFTNQIYYPEGSAALYHSWSFYNLFLSYPLQLLLPPAAVYNVLVMLIFPVAGLGAFKLAKYFTRNSLVSILAGYIFAFNPLIVAHSQQHLNIASALFTPYFVLYFIRCVREKSRKTLLLACVFFLLNALCDWNHLIFALFFMAGGYLYLILKTGRLFIRDYIVRSVAVVGCTAITLSPWLAPMIMAGLRNPDTAGLGHNYFVADLIGLFTPSVHHCIASTPFIKSVNETYTGNACESAAYLGLGSVLVVALAFRRLINSSPRLLLGGLFVLIMAMGAHPHIVGNTVPVILPFRVLQFVPFLSSVRAPARLLIYVHLFLSVMVALAMQILYYEHRWKWRHTLLPVAASLLIFFDLFPVRLQSTEVSAPPCYAKLPKSDEEFGVLDLPSGYVEVDTYMMYQTIHRLPIVQGWVSRKIGTSLIDHLEFVDLERQKLQLSEAKVRYIVVHKRFLPRRRVDPDRYKDHYPVLYDDPQTTVFQVY